MKVNLIGDSFDINSGQGIYRYSGELFEGLTTKGLEVSTNLKGDINHVQQPELIWKALFKKNVITTIHDVMPIFNDERKPLFRFLFYLLVLISTIKSKKIIAVSKCTEKDINRYFPWANKKIKVVYEAVDSSIFYPNKKEKNKKVTIGYLGGLGKRKNVEFILKLAKELPEVNFKIGGKGQEKDNLESIACELKLKNISFEGFVPKEKMNEFYNSLNIFIFPSYYEGFGLPALEAMACGVPCLASDRGSLPEIVPNNQFIMDIEDLTNTAGKIKDLYKHKRKLDIMAKQCLSKTKEFSQDKFIKETIEVYNIK